MHCRVIRTMLAAAGACAFGAGASGEGLSIDASSALTLQPLDPPASQATGVAPVLEAGDHWDFDLDLIFWLPWDASVDITAESVTADAQVNVDDLFDGDESYSPEVRFEAWSGDGWGIVVAAAYLGLSADGSSGTQNGVPVPTAIDSELEWYYLDVQLGVRLLDAPPDNTGFGAARTDFFAGVRYGHVDIEHVAQSNQARADGDDDYIEPLFGLRNALSIRDDLWWSTRLELSGGGGSMTNFTWLIETGVEWEIRNRLEMIAGYRIQGIDYDQEPGGLDFGLDGRFHGPYFGLRFAF